jgi:hypothetical protein
MLFSLMCAVTFAEPNAAIRDSAAKLQTELSAQYGESVRPRLTGGIQQVVNYWRTEDGDAKAFETFVKENFIADAAKLQETFNRLEYVFEQLDGHLHEIDVTFRRQTHLDLGPVLPLDEILATYDSTAHLNDDFFKNKVAFIVLLNFPVTTLEEKLKDGPAWSRLHWAQARLAERFSKRIPAEVNQEIRKALSEAELYIAEYNIWMHHLLDENGKRLFPPKLRLLSHWNLRDELKANYAEPEGLAKQLMIQKVMERIVTQTIPRVVINNPHVDWNPFSNQVLPAAAMDSDSPVPAGLQVTNDPEPDTRYATLLSNFHAARKLDEYSPTAPTHMARKFDEERELPESRVQKMFEDVLTSPVVPRVAKLIESRLGRKLQPFDIWYNGFRPRGKYTEAELDQIVARKYPTADAYASDMPNLLQGLGFSKSRAEYLASNIIVEPARGSGHAWGAGRRGDQARLRTRVEKDGMNYKGYNIAIHEMGHNVEQTFSLNDVDHTLLQGVPNTAFTEALAFVFQARDLELLGLGKQDATGKSMKTLNDLWATYEIAGVALVDMAVWNWMYAHPQATASQLREATVQISKDIWNKYYAPVFGRKDVVLLGIYSHMINEMLYLPDYPIGHMIALQVEEQMDWAGNLGSEFERITKTGRVTPDLWMKTATGSPVGPEALLRATEEALKQVSSEN